MATFDDMGALLFLGFLRGLKVCCDHNFKFFKYCGLQLGLKTPLYLLFCMNTVLQYDGVFLTPSHSDWQFS